MAERSASRPLTGKAVTYKHLGGYEAIEIVERTVRAPAAGEVRIEVKAAGVNPTDVLLRTPGSELLGAMPALGSSVLDTMIPTPSNRGT